MNRYTLINRHKDLIANPNPRIPICLCLDTSSSMGGAPIASLNSGVQLFYDTIKQDLIASGVAEIAVVTFGAGGVRCHTDFAGVESVPHAPQFHAGGNTPMGEAVNLALNKLTERRKDYCRSGVEYYKPWLILMTDGQNNGSMKEYKRAQQRVADLCAGGNLDFLPIGIGAGADMAGLAGFSSRHKPYKLNGLRFREFFSWLSRSVSRVSCSMPGQECALSALPTSDWSTL